MTPAPSPGWRALDPDFDRAVLAIAAKHFPDGFETSPHAPATYDQLAAFLDAGNVMTIWDGGSTFTIYGDPATNHAYRAWHDLVHQRLRQPFTLPGEAAVAQAQADEISAMCNDVEQARRFRAIVFAEGLGQALYHDLHGQFPGNQRRFVRAFLDVLLESEANVTGGIEHQPLSPPCGRSQPLNGTRDDKRLKPAD